MTRALAAIELPARRQQPELPHPLTKWKKEVSAAGSILGYGPRILVLDLEIRTSENQTWKECEYTCS